MAEGTRSVGADRRQAWRVVGAGFVLIAIGMFGLVAGLHLSDRLQSSKVAALTATVRANHARITSNQARISQLEDDYRRHNLPIPPPTTTTTTAPRRRVAATTTSTASSTTSSTTRPTTTTTTAPCPVNVAGHCIGRKP